jgi:hypothetical protein
MSEPHHAHKMLGSVLAAQTEALCMSGLTFAQLNGAAAFSVARAEEGGPARSVVVLLAGPIPDDLVESIGEYLQATVQDLKSEGKLKTLYEG